MFLKYDIIFRNNVSIIRFEVYVFLGNIIELNPRI